MEYLKIFTELLASLAWPVTILIIVFYFKEKVETLLAILVKRFESTSQVELPGGFKASFFKEKLDSVKQIAEEAINSVESSISEEQKITLQKHLETALLQEDVPLLILSHISSFGLLNRSRLSEFASDSKINEKDIDEALDALMDFGYIIKKEGAFHVTHEGVKKLQYEKEKPKLTRRSTRTA